VEAVGDHPRVGQSATDRGAERGAQVDGHVADAGLPPLGLGAQPSGHRGRVAALDLAEQAAPADGVDESDVPGVGGQLPSLGIGVLFPDGFAASDLVDPDRLTCGWVLGQGPDGVVGETAPGGGPGQAQVASGLDHGTGAVADGGPGRLAQGGSRGRGAAGAREGGGGGCRGVGGGGGGRGGAGGGGGGGGGGVTRHDGGGDGGGELVKPRRPPGGGRGAPPPAPRTNN